MDQDQLILLLRNNERSAFIYVYDTFYPVLARYIHQHGGTREDAEDLFQETVIVLIRNIKRDSFQLSSSMKTYLYAINKNLWLKKVRQD
ncbi:MAG: subfamily polymerase sigma-24 subunit, partial [Chitinophagaceae bacterium]|nr:subfamily polymerase sigma-24 subunit [Chitinophagaceae bacterium]